MLTAGDSHGTGANEAARSAPDSRISPTISYGMEKDRPLDVESGISNQVSRWTEMNDGDGE